jgi:hypothetical protein
VLLVPLGCAIDDYNRICTAAAGSFNVIPGPEGYACYINPGFTIYVVFPDGVGGLVTYVYQTASGEQDLVTRCFIGLSTELPMLELCEPGEPEPMVMHCSNPCDGALCGEGEPHCTPPIPGPCSSYLFFRGSFCDRIGECNTVLGGPCPETSGDPGCPDTCSPDFASERSDSFDLAAFLIELASQPETTFRGHRVIKVPLRDISLRSPDGAVGQVPLSGGISLYVDRNLMKRTVFVDITSAASREFRWLLEWIQEHGSLADASVSIGKATGSKTVTFFPENIERGLERVESR